MSVHADTIRRYLNAEVLDIPPSEFQAKAEASLDALLAENQRLRDALAEIADNPYGDTDLAFVRGIAREALAGDTE